MTGGIGTGKSEVSRVLAELGASVVDADEVGHRAYLPGSPAWQEIVGRWGERILLPDGTVDRDGLGAIVFSDSEELAALNRIVHGRMFQMLREEIDRRRNAAGGRGVIVLEAAVLIEAGWTPLVDQIWVVVADERAVLDRMARLKGMRPEDVHARASHQLSDEERSRHATVVINNNGSLADLRAQVAAAWQSHVAEP